MRLAFRHHDRAGVEVAVDQGFRRAHEFELEPRDRHVQVEVFAKGAAVASSQGDVQRFCSATR